MHLIHFISPKLHLELNTIYTHTHTDIDECVEELNNCSEHAHCMDTEGGFRCRCNLGFRDISVNQDGTNCTGKLNFKVKGLGKFVI